MTLKDDLLKHQILLQRLGATHAQTMRNYINEAINTAISSLRQNPQGLSKPQLRQLHSSIVAVLHKMPAQQMQMLQELVSYEADFIISRLVYNNLLGVAKRPDEQVLTEALDTLKMSVNSGGTKYKIKNALTQFANVKASEIVLQVSDVSVSKEESKVETGTNRLLALAAGLYAAQTLTMGKTTVTQASSAARQEVYKENEIAKVDWVTELDSDVCPDCEALGSGSPYDVGDSEIPPEHWNCRCVLVPVND